MTRAGSSSTRVRTRFSVDGTVQGVGFRPFVYGLANDLGLAGFVLNNSSGVVIEVEGDRAAVDRFEAALTSDPPPLAVIEAVGREELTPVGSRLFEIRTSASGGELRAGISPDIATCPAGVGGPPPGGRTQGGGRGSRAGRIPGDRAEELI